MTGLSIAEKVSTRLSGRRSRDLIYRGKSEIAAGRAAEGLILVEDRAEYRSGAGRRSSQDLAVGEILREPVTDRIDAAPLVTDGGGRASGVLPRSGDGVVGVAFR